MKKENLVVLKGSIIRGIWKSKTETEFSPNKHYRCIELLEGGYSEFLINGVVMSRETFEYNFEYLFDRMIKEFKTIGLVSPNGHKISKSAFNEHIDVHQYGKGQNKLFIGFVGNKVNGMYAFQPLCKGDTKVRFLKQIYQMYCDVLKGDMTNFDDEMIQRGNSGIPLSFRDIYFKKEISLEILG